MTAAPFRWAETIGVCGSGEGRIVEIDVAVPGQEDYEPVVLTVQAARVLYAMLGDALANEQPGRGTDAPRRRLHSVPTPVEA